MFDNGRWCECEKCKNSGNYSSRVHIVINDILKEMKQASAEGGLNGMFL